MVLIILKSGVLDWQLGGQVAINEIRGARETFNSWVMELKACWESVTERELKIIVVTFYTFFLDSLNSLRHFCTFSAILMKEFSLVMHL